MNHFENVLKTKVLGGVLVAGMAVPSIAGVPMLAQARGGFGGPQYVQSEYHGVSYGAQGSYGGDGYYGGYDQGVYVSRHHGVGPGTGALIGAVAGAANRDAHRGYGYDGYGYSNSYGPGYGDNRGYGYGPYGR